MLTTFNWLIKTFTLQGCRQADIKVCFQTVLVWLFLPLETQVAVEFRTSLFYCSFSWMYIAHKSVHTSVDWRSPLSMCLLSWCFQVNEFAVVQVSGKQTHWSVRNAHGKHTKVCSFPSCGSRVCAGWSSFIPPDIESSAGAIRLMKGLY